MTDHPVLSHLARFGIHLGLDRIRSLLAELGDPHQAFPVLHVAGTNGKGSVVRMLSSVLRAQGYRVGEYSSPHLQRVNERVRVDGVEISDEDLDALLRELDEVRVAWARESLGGEVAEDQVLTYFEMMTALGFVHLARSKVDVGVIEVGLGGRLDATNVVEPLVTGITHIGLDHADRLGDDLGGIASEKAGIVKTAKPVVVGPLPVPALRVVRTVAADREAPLIEPGVDYRISGRCDAFSWKSGDRHYPDLTLSLDGDHQVDNAGVALAMLHQLPDPFEVTEDAIRRGLRAARPPGRMEWLASNLLVDCAHNADGAARLADFLRALPRDRQRTLLLGCSNDKDVRSFVTIVAPCVDRVMTTQCRHPRALAPGDLAKQFVDVSVPVLPAGPIEQALPLARSEDDLVVVSGSAFLVGAVRELIGMR